MEGEMRKCAACGGPFSTKDSDRNWCSSKCREKIDPTFHRRKRKKKEGRRLTVQYHVDDPGSAIFTE